jgi:hypothetical protein
MKWKETKVKKLISLMILLIIFLSACSGSTSPTNTNSAEKMTEYVGEIPETEFYVAIAVGSTGEVLAYVCNGMGIDYLFRGSLQAENVLELNSEAGGAVLQAKIENAGFTGTFSANGNTYPFTVVPVKDFGGLYKVTGLSEFEAEGISQAGSLLKLTLLPDETGLHVDVTTFDGNTLTADRFWTEGHDHSAPVEYREHWVILLNDGSGHGGRIKSSFQSGVRGIDPICVP